MNTPDTTGTAQARSRWGSSRIGGGPGTLIAVCLAIGALLAAAVGWLTSTLVGQDNPQLMFWVAFPLVLPAGVVLPWVLLVDRNTLRGAVAKPEESVESSWYDKAASGAFTDTLLIAGLGTTAVAISGVQVPTHLVGLGLVLAMMACFGLRYLHLKRTNA